MVGVWKALILLFILFSRWAPNDLDGRVWKSYSLGLYIIFLYIYIYIYYLELYLGLYIIYNIKKKIKKTKIKMKIKQHTKKQNIFQIAATIHSRAELLALTTTVPRIWSTEHSPPQSHWIWSMKGRGGQFWSTEARGRGGWEKEEKEGEAHGRRLGHGHLHTEWKGEKEEKEGEAHRRAGHMGGG
jgi:hypothetical protein